MSSAISSTCASDVASCIQLYQRKWQHDSKSANDRKIRESPLNAFKSSKGNVKSRVRLLCVSGVRRRRVRLFDRGLSSTNSSQRRPMNWKKMRGGDKSRVQRKAVQHQSCGCRQFLVWMNSWLISDEPIKMAASGCSGSWWSVGVDSFFCGQSHEAGKKKFHPPSIDC